MKVGILGAMNVEVECLCKKLERTIVKSIAGTEFHAGQLNGISVVIVKCGIGKVNAAICTQAMIDHFDVDCIVNTGVAGGLSPNLNVFDVVISKDLIQHDFDTSNAGDELGHVPGFENIEFEASERLYNIALELGQKIYGKEKIFLGRIATGDQFINDRNIKDKIIKNFGAMCVEMEGAAIAQTCFLNNMPYLVIRTISDSADDKAEVDYFEFVEKAAVNSTILVEELVVALYSLDV